MSQSEQKIETYALCGRCLRNGRQTVLTYLEGVQVSEDRKNRKKVSSFHCSFCQIEINNPERELWCPECWFSFNTDKQSMLCPNRTEAPGIRGAPCGSRMIPKLNIIWKKHITIA